MIKRLAFYSIGIYILGLIFSGVTYIIMDFVPYFISGMIITTPIYGLVKRKTGKGKFVHKGINKAGKGFKHLLKLSKQSITTYLIVLVVVYNTYKDLSETLVDSVVIGMITLALTFMTWESVRFITKKSKKIQLLSFGEAIKGAF